MLCFVVGALLPPGAASAVEIHDRDFEQWRGTLNSATAILDSRYLTGRDIATVNERVEAIRKRLSELRADAEKTLNERKKLLNTLGPRPKLDDRPESPEIGEERARIEAAIAKWDGQVKQADLLLQHTAELLKESATRANMVKAVTLVTRKPSPVSVERVGRLPLQLRWFAETVAYRLMPDALEAMERLFRPIPLAILAAGLFAIGAAARSAHHWLRRRRREPGPGARRRRLPVHIAAIADVLRDGAIPAGAAVAAIALIVQVAGIDGHLRDLSVILAAWCAGLLTLHVWIRSIFLSTRILPRTNPRDPVTARKTVRRLTMLSNLVLLSYVVRAAGEALGAGESLYEAAQLLIRTVSAVGAVLLLHPALWNSRGRGTPVSSMIVHVVLVVFAVNPLFMLAGYGRLADWVFFGLAGTLMVLEIARALQNAMREGIGLLIRQRRRRSRDSQAELPQPIADGTIGQALAFGVVQLLFWGVALLALFQVWGVEGLRSLALSDLFGKEISVGGVNVSLFDAALALAALGLGLVLTRVGQSALDRRVLRRARIDHGTRNALRTGIGYTGFTLAVALSVSALGIDLSKLALIAGALSVGVGFGLQTTVSNFVSGIVLLVERPVKPGDWVKVGDFEGLVRHIRVRATEIETFQRSSVLVPNSEIVSKAVVNWTFNDPTGRVDVEIGVDQDCDVRHVFELLQTAMRQHPNVLGVPHPRAFLRSVSQGALNFELWAYIDVRDSQRKVRVESELLSRIVTDFRAAGIRIAQPFPEIGPAIADIRSAHAAVRGGAPERPLDRIG